MGVIRTFGLIFFMTILIGGCVVAVNTYPGPDPISYNSELTGWDQAVTLLHQGQVIGFTQTSQLTVYFALRDGSRVISVAPTVNALHEALLLCGGVCAGIQTSNL